MSEWLSPYAAADTTASHPRAHNRPAITVCSLGCGLPVFGRAANVSCTARATRAASCLSIMVLMCLFAGRNLVWQQFSLRSAVVICNCRAAVLRARDLACLLVYGARGGVPHYHNTPHNQSQHYTQPQPTPILFQLFYCSESQI